MNKTLYSLIFSLFLTCGFGQSAQDIVGTWKFQAVKTTNPACKSVDSFPISTFTFRANGTAEFKSGEGHAQARYKMSNNVIHLFDLSENGVKQEGTGTFGVKSVSNDTLILTVEYECGSIDMVFKK